MPQLYILFEHTSGFAVFRTTKFEEEGLFLPQVQCSMTDISKFKSIVFLVAFQPFETQKEALENMKSIAADELNTDLQLFLENNIPRSKKTKQAVVLGVQEPSLAAIISDKLGINCTSSAVIEEIIRGIRFYFHRLVKGFTDSTSANETQLALVHRFFREKTNFDADRQDCIVFQSLSLVDELEKDINTLTERIKEWYSLHFPELFNILQGNAELYIRCIQEIGNINNMPEDIKDKLTPVVEDSSKVETILQAVSNSMGMEISPVDLENIQMLCQRVLELIKNRQMSLDYLKAKMNSIAPNLSALVGELVGSRLISRAGSLIKLAKLPASSFRILGADNKLFRTVEGEEKPEKFGLISKSAFIGKAGMSKKRHLETVLANKCSLAAKVDCFSGKSDERYGCQLIQEVEKAVKYREEYKPDVNGEKKKTENDTKAAKRRKGEKENNSNTVNNDASVVDNHAVLNGESSSEESVLNSGSDKIIQKRKKFSSLDKDDKIGESSDNEMCSEENLLTSISKMKLKQKKILSKLSEEDAIEVLSEKIPKKRKSLSKKRKSKGLETSIIERLDEEASEMPRKRKPRNQQKEA